MKINISLLKNDQKILDNSNIENNIYCYQNLTMIEYIIFIILEMYNLLNKTIKISYFF